MDQVEIISILQSNMFKREKHWAWVAPDGMKFTHAEEAYRYLRKLERKNLTLKELINQRR